jgi:glycerophosphoryl diester phosphodiesterase
MRPSTRSPAYRLAIEMRADYVEQDLAVTKDGVLICLHDASLERTTNVEQLFPDRSMSISIEGQTRKAWVANDFTLAEIKRLDAGRGSTRSSPVRRCRPSTKRSR